MATSEIASRASWTEVTFPSVVLILGVLTIVRIVALQFSVVDLFYDEAQYWAWSQELAAGYFSKPPLLAWIIAGSNAVCGTGEACVRVASPLIYFATCIGIYALASELYGARVAGWSALTFALGTGLAFSARIISTDVPLIFFWTVALLACVKLLKTPEWRWTMALGVALGLGLLAKYAMIYFILCAVFAACIDRDARVLWTRPQILIALVIATAIVAPNIYWNLANDLATLRHTGDNVTGDGFGFAPWHVLEFLGSQFVVAGPLVFAAFIFILIRFRDAAADPADRLMLAFAIPPLALIVALSFVRSAHGNWAAPAMPAMTILAVAWWLRTDRWRWLAASLAIGIAVQTVLLIGDANAYRIAIPMLGTKSDIYARTLGWRGLGERGGELARREHTPTVAAEGRAETAALIYYLRKEPVRVASWPAAQIPEHHFDMTRALDASAAEPVLFISSCPIADRLVRNYDDITILGPIAISTGLTTTRTHFAFKLAKRRDAIQPLGPCLNRR